jgi:diguanylate cyclase (GGDEF)-like protein
MASLDLFTLNWVTLANMYLSSSAMYFVSAVNGRRDAIRYCAAAGFVTSTGFALAPMRSLVPWNILNLVSNVLIFLGSSLLLRGIRAFRDLRMVRRRRFVALQVVYTLVFASFMYGIDSLRVRTVLASVSLAALMAACCHAVGVGVERRDRPVYWTTAGLYALSAVALSIRALWFTTAIPYASTFSSHPVEFLNIVAVNLAAMGGAFGLCLATNLRLMRETEMLALYDPLTGLPNRRLLDARLAQAEARAHASGLPLALIYCDLDDFKSVNDSLGHEAGDKVLRLVAHRLRAFLSEDACLARVGGDEFIVLIENAAPRKALAGLVEKLLSAVSEPIELDGRSISPAISCGLAVFPEDVERASDLVGRADAAMYSMKQHGRMEFARE